MHFSKNTSAHKMEESESAAGNPAMDGLNQNEDLLERVCPVSFSVSVVLPAAGSGERSGLSIPKQFCKILGRPLISLTIHAFERVIWIQHIVVVVAHEHFDMMTDILHKYNHTKVTIVEGGPTRHRSIFNGLHALGKGTNTKLQKPKVVIIHDAVRPFIEEDFLLKITLAANNHGASGAVRPLVSTVIAKDPDGYLDHSLERARYRASEMPQGFLHDVIFQAYEKCSESEFEFGTECLALALQHSGVRAALIEGPTTLWKVTYKQDLISAEAAVKDYLSQTVCIIAEDGGEMQNLSKGITNYLMAMGIEVETALRTGLSMQSTGLYSINRNFIQLSMKKFDLVEIEDILKTCDECRDMTVFPVVFLWVNLKMSKQINSSEETEVSAIMNAGREAQKRNIFLYCVQLHYNQVETLAQWNSSMDRLCQLILALIRDRSSAFVGQTLQV